MAAGAREFAESLLAAARASVERHCGGTKAGDLGATELQRIVQILDEVPSASAAFLAILGPAPPPLPSNGAGVGKASTAGACMDVQGGPEMPAPGPEEKGRAVALVARFCAVQRGHGDLMVQTLFQQALRLDPVCAMAIYGITRARAEASEFQADVLAPATMEPDALGDADVRFQDGAGAKAAAEVEATASCFRDATRCACLLSDAVAAQAHPSPGLEYDASQCLFLLESSARRLLLVDPGSVAFGGPLAPEVCWSLLESLAPLLRTSGALALESLTRRLLLQGMGPEFGVSELLTGLGPIESVALPPFVRAALAESEVFCHVALESTVAAWRARLTAELAPRLLGDVRPAIGYDMISVALGNAAAVAMHCHFVGYCIPLCNKESESAAASAARAGLLRQEGEGAIDGPSARVELREALFVLAAMYDSVGLAEGDFMLSLESATEASFSQPRLRPHSRCLEELLTRSVHGPHKDIEAAAALPRLTDAALLPDDDTGSPCRDFYEEIIYPPWHDGVDAIGRLPLSPIERIQRLFPEARAPSGAGGVLIAGCGSGKQIANELRSYAGCPIVAFDISARSVAYAQRRLERLLPPFEFHRIEFCVGDIERISPATFGGRAFDVVVCVGVLHHLKDPAEGLRRLAALLEPSAAGVLHLATYSTLGSRPLLDASRAWLREAAPTRGLFDGEGQLLRRPTRAEVRDLRQVCLEGLSVGHPVRELCTQSRDFATTSGVLDLLFHPRECSFTLLELQDLLCAVEFQPLGMLCHNPHRDWENRQRYAAAGSPLTEGDPMRDLARWHDVETKFPETFGRMHTVFAQRGFDH